MVFFVQEAVLNASEWVKVAALSTLLLGTAYARNDLAWLGFPVEAPQSAAAAPAAAIAQRDPRILSIVQRHRFEKQAPGLTGERVWSAEYIVTLDGRVDLGDLKALAANAAREVPRDYWLGLRFVLAGWPRPNVESLTQMAAYGWVLFRDGREDAAMIHGLSLSEERRQIDAFTLRPGEKLYAAFRDPYSLIGLVAITERDSRMYFVNLVSPEARMPLVSAQSLTECGSVYRCWRVDSANRSSDVAKVAIGASGGPLIVFAGHSSLPWLLAYPLPSDALDTAQR